MQRIQNSILVRDAADPTNDWWTHLLFNETDSALWIYPQMLQTINEGFRLFSRVPLMKVEPILNWALL